jgi:hypothetical protein
MNIEELRKKSIEQFAQLRRQALLEAQRNAAVTVLPQVAAAGAGSGGGGIKDCSINEYVENDYICDYFE